jgi:hypothetical protein
MSTITITVNIATGNMWEGNAEFKMDLPEKHIKHLDRNKLASELNTLFDKACADYGSKNYPEQS